VALCEDFLRNDPAPSEVPADVEVTDSNSSTNTNLEGSSRRLAFTKVCAMMSWVVLRTGTLGNKPEK